MEEDNQHPKPTNQDVEEEINEESRLPVASPKDGQTKNKTSDQHAKCDTVKESCSTEVLRPEQQLILKALQKVVGSSLQNETKREILKSTDPKPKSAKLKKTCRKRGMNKKSKSGDAKSIGTETENTVSETTGNLLASLADALDYVEMSYIPAPRCSGHSNEEDIVHFEAEFDAEEVAELELVAEIQIGDMASCWDARSGISRRNRQWRIQKSVCLRNSGLHVRHGQSAGFNKNVFNPSGCKGLVEPNRSPLTMSLDTLQTFHRNTIHPNGNYTQNTCASDRMDSQDNSHLHPSTAVVLPGLSWIVPDSNNLLLLSREGKDPIFGRTTLIHDNTQPIINTSPDSFISLGLALGNGTGVTSGQHRPGGAESSTSNQHSHPPNSLEKTDSNSSSSSSSSSQIPNLSASGNGAQSNTSQDLDIYDPFHPTDEENVNGDYIYEDSPEKEADEQEDQKYDPFDPTGSNPSSSERSPSPYDDEDEDEEEGNESHPEGRISEALAGIYDENSLSQDFPGIDKEKEIYPTSVSEKVLGIEGNDGNKVLESNKTDQKYTMDPSESTGKENAKSALEPYSPSSSLDLDRVDEVELVSREISEEKSVKESPLADSTLSEGNISEVLTEPRRRVFTVDVGSDYSRKTEFTSDTESKSKLEIKVSLESIAKPDVKSYLRLEKIAKLGGESRSRHKRKHSSERNEHEEESDRKYDSEIEEGEIVQPDEERFSPMRLFRNRCRVLERPLRIVEGDDFLSLHADSDEEGALQIDFGENQMDNRWKGLDLRRKITNQRRERYRKKSESPPKPKRNSKSRTPSSPRGRKKSKRDRKRSRERKRSKEPRTSTATTTNTTWSSAKKSKDSRDHKRSRSRSHNKVSRSHSRDRRRSRSWSPSISTSISAVGSLRTSAERRKSQRSKSKEKRRCWSRSVSTDRSRKDKHKEKHRTDGKKKKKRSRSKSRDRERRSSHRSSDRRDKDKIKSRHPVDEPKLDNPGLLDRRRRDSRSVVPPSIQDLNNADLFSIKRTITVNPEEKLDDRDDLLNTPGKREVLYDSEGLSFETFSDREILDDRDGKGNRIFDRHSSKSESLKRRTPVDFEKKRIEDERERRLKATKDRDRKRSYTEESHDRYKKRFKDIPDTETEPFKLEKDKIRLEKDKTSKKLKTGHKESKGGSARKVKLQSKVNVLIREGVSSTTSVKEAGSIGVKFSRDRESRSPFLKSEEKILEVKSNRPKLEPVDDKEPTVKPKKIKGLKTKTGLKKVKTTGAAGILAKPKGPQEKKKKKLKTKASLKKSKADSCSKELPSPIQAKDEPIWSDTENTESKIKPPSPLKPPIEQELTPDSQTVDSSCKTPDVSFIPEEPPPEPERSTDLEVDSISEPKEEIPRAPPPPMPWNLQSGVDCTTSGVLALTALLFKMEEANLASRAKAQELIQATNQILSQSKPSTSLSQPPAPSMITSLGHSAPSYPLYSGLPLSGNSSPPTPTGVSTLTSQALSGSSSFFNTLSSNDLGKREGSTSSEGRGDTDKYLKKLHTQERAVEEVKLAIKPYYQKKEITKEDYKDILRKAVHKICHSKSGEINPVKVNNLVKAYVQRYKYFRKHGKKMEDEESSTSYRSSKDPGSMEKGIPSLPLI
ncbi:hypothetical protein GDO86_012325 [Hymenochirus boettgeri]|uniref:SFR19-like C-terminal domain-containing protein n=1 Tax=Hymenochirus boettgeri TaxID=247094 RepID=A0A8T2IQ82_9PIPI|nr:hypothetical protein GDO86_012325 [Hymenochirus boettgeri]